jgi:hypothetical protein
LRERERERKKTLKPATTKLEILKFKGEKC